LLQSGVAIRLKKIKNIRVVGIAIIMTATLIPGFYASLMGLGWLLAMIVTLGVTLYWPTAIKIEIAEINKELALLKPLNVDDNEVEIHKLKGFAKENPVIAERLKEIGRTPLMGEYLALKKLSTKAYLDGLSS